MHEMSLAQSLLEQISQLQEEHKARTVLRVVVTLGPFSGIVADSFSFGFTVLKEHFPGVEKAVLELISPAPEYICLACKQVVSFEQKQAEDDEDLTLIIGRKFSTKQCPHCDSSRLSPHGGTELILNTIEME